MFFDDSAMDCPSWVGNIYNSWQILGDEVNTNTQSASAGDRLHSCYSFIDYWLTFPSEEKVPGSSAELK